MCDTCQTILRTEEGLMTHKKLFHGIETFACDECSFKASKEPTLVEHTAECHQTKKHVKNKENKGKHETRHVNDKDVRDNKSICYFFNYGGCKYGDSCEYVHKNFTNCIYQDNCYKKDTSCPFFHQVNKKSRNRPDNKTPHNSRNYRSRS